MAAESHEEQHCTSEVKLCHSSSAVLCHSKRKRVGARTTARTTVLLISGDIFYSILVYVYRLRDAFTIFIYAIYIFINQTLMGIKNANTTLDSIILHVTLRLGIFWLNNIENELHKKYIISSLFCIVDNHHFI